jgi:hypothetical protein
VAIWELRILIWASAFSAWLLAILPVLYYLWNGSGWQARKEKIVNSFNAKALALYYDLYFPGRAIKQTEVTKTFDIDYGKYYGRRHFVLPVVLLSLICGEAMWGLGRTVEEWLGVAQGPKYLPAMAVSAIAGAWMWVVSDQLTRLRNGDFARGDVSTAAFRFVIAIPFGYAIASLDPTFGLTLAFFHWGVSDANTFYDWKAGDESAVENGGFWLVRYQRTRTIAERWKINCRTISGRGNYPQSPSWRGTIRLKCRFGRIWISIMWWTV